MRVTTLAALQLLSDLFLSLFTQSWGANTISLHSAALTPYPSCTELSLKMFKSCSNSNLINQQVHRWQQNETSPCQLSQMAKELCGYAQSSSHWHTATKIVSLYILYSQLRSQHQTNNNKRPKKSDPLADNTQRIFCVTQTFSVISSMSPLSYFQLSSTSVIKPPHGHIDHLVSAAAWEACWPAVLLKLLNQNR